MSEKVRYKNPPIMERIIGAYHSIPQEHFEARLPSWIEKISGDYPIPEPLAEWIIDIESKGGVPFVKSLTPKARIIHLFWKRHPKGHHVRGLRLRPDRLVFHLRREENDPHDFDELLPEMERWLPRWAEHFGVPDLDGITLEYQNQLNPVITPQFIGPKGNLKIGDVLSIFGKFPGPAKSITNPYDCKARLVIDEAKPTFFDVRVYADPAMQGVRVDFAVRTFPTAKRLTFSESLAELRIGHEIMLAQFDCFFTDQAKLSFGK